MRRRNRGMWTIFALVKTHSKSDLNRRTICYCWTSYVSIGHFFFTFRSLRRVKITHFTTDFPFKCRRKHRQSIISHSRDWVFVYYYNILLSTEWPSMLEFRFLEQITRDISRFITETRRIFGNQHLLCA